MPPERQKCPRRGGRSLLRSERGSSGAANTRRRTFMDIYNSTANVARAALLAGAIALGVSTFGHPAIASAEWDIEKYDNCMAQPHVEDPHHPYHADCCVASGGITDGEGHCRAPVDLTAPETPLG